MMQKWISAALLAGVLWLSAALPAAAQYTVVASCPGVVAIYAAGQVGRSPLVDVNGNVCTSAGGGGGGTVTVLPSVYTPTSPTTSGARTLVTGGTAQTLFTAGEVVHDCLILNPATATERIWVNYIGTAVAAAGGDSFPLEIGQGVACGGGLTTGTSWIAATTGHTISAFKK